MDTQTQIDRLIELAIVQRSELKQLVEQLPQLREYLGTEIEKTFEQVEPQLRTELEEFCNKKTEEYVEALRGDVSEQVGEILKTLEVSAAAKYSALMAERERNTELEKRAEEKIAQHAASLPSAVKGIVEAELARFPRAGEIDQLRKEFAEPRGLNPRGKWQSGETYNKLDLVAFNGDSFVSNIDGNTEKPNRGSAVWTLSAARGVSGGGGGATSLTDLVPVPSNGQLLIGNGSAFVNNTLTAGTGITITNGAGTITIDASGAQETLTATVKNAESVAITRGQVVYLYSATGGFASVKLAYNTSDATSAKTFGVVSDASIAPNGTGTVTCVGVVDKLNLGAYNDGDTVYLGATAGTITTTKPYAPNHLVYVGIIERANAGNGELYVRVQNGYELDEIHDVQIITPPAAGAVLVRDATNSLWKAAQIAGTANQITVTNADAAVTLSIPTNPTLNGNVNITGSSTIAGGLNLTSSSVNGYIYDGTGFLWTSNGLSSGTVKAAIYAAGNQLFLTSNSSIATNRFFLDSSGNATVANNLTVSGGQIAIAASSSTPSVLITQTDPAAYSLFRLRNTGGTAQSYDFAVGGSGTGSLAQKFYVYDGTAGAVRLAIAPTTGNVLIGSTVDGGQKLQVAGSAILSTAEPVLNLSSTAASSIAYQLIAGGGSGHTTGTFKIYDSSLGYTVLSHAKGTSGPSTRLSFDAAGVATFASTAASTSTTTGALVVSGGVGVAGAGYFGGNLTVSGQGDFATGITTTGSPSLPAAWNGARGLGIDGSSATKRIYFGDGTGYFLKFSSRIASTTTDRFTFDDTGNFTATGNLTVGGTGVSSVAGDFGVGTATPAGRLQVISGSSPNAAQVIVGYGGSNNFFDANDNIFRNGSFTESMRLKSTGNLLLGTTTDSGNGKLQLATHTTSAGGIGFGTDWSLYRLDQYSIALNGTAGSSVLRFYESGTLKGLIGTTAGTTYLDSLSGSIILRTNGGTTALTLDSSQRCILAGALRLNNAYVSGAPTATGYVTLQDSAGNTYKVLVGT